MKCTSALLVCLVLTMLSGCKVLTPVVSKMNELQKSSLCKEITNLVNNQFLADSGTLSLVYVEKSDLKLEKCLVNTLKSKGYAIEHVLPKELLQKGDKDVKESGVKTTINLIDLKDDENLIIVDLRIKDYRYSALFKKSLSRVFQVSPWSKLNIIEEGV